MIINVENDAMLGRNNDSIYATKFYVMQKQIDELQQSNKQLKDNWNKLKEYAKEVISTDNELYGTDLLDKIQELEQGSDNNVKD